MRSVTRSVREPAGPVHIRPPRRYRPGAGTAAAAIALADELLTHGRESSDTAEQALMSFRRQSRAAEVVFWMVNGGQATAALRAGISAPDVLRPVVELTDHAVVGERLRRRGALVCRAGEVSGVEALVPDGVRSFAVVAVPRDHDVLGVLVVGWRTSEPACDAAAIAQLRRTAAVLLWTVANLEDIRVTPAESILGSITHHVAVVDQAGTIVSMNAAWSQFPFHLNAFDSVQVGANYFESCRRAAAAGGVDLEDLRHGIEQVARRESPLYQATFRLPAAGREEWVLLNATPLRDASGGAVIAHIGITPEKAGDLASRLGERHFYELTDALLMPVWIHRSDGRVIHGNARWRHIAEVWAESYTGRWTDLFHPADRARVVAAFQAEAGRISGVDVRMRVADGIYRWASCDVAPFAGVDGHMHAYVGSCHDVGTSPHGDRSFTDMSRLAVAQDEERSRIARELHDDLGQQAALLAANISTLSTAGNFRTSRLRDLLADANRNVQELAMSIHNLSHQLHPPRLRLLGLVKTIDALCRDISKQRGVRVRFRSSQVPPDVPERIALCVCRVAQEAVQNAVKHSGARAVHVDLTGDDLELTLSVVDRGRGFDPRSAVTSGLGLVTMRERVELSGGRFAIDSQASVGTRITAILPLSPPRPNDIS